MNILYLEVFHVEVHCLYSNGTSRWVSFGWFIILFGYYRWNRTSSPRTHLLLQFHRRYICPKGKQQKTGCYMLHCLSSLVVIS